MLEVASILTLEEAEAAIRRGAHRNGASVLSITHIGHLLRERASTGGDDAVVFTICHPELYSALLAAEIRLAGFLPCRVAAVLHEGRVTFHAGSPMEYCRILNRSDLAPLAGPLESLLLRIMQDAAQCAATAAHAAQPVHRRGLGATEEQVHLRGSIPQRIDCHGTKVEELAGTGEHDSQGG